MADVLRQLALLLVATIVLLLVVLLHVCFAGRSAVPRRKRRPIADVDMDGRWSSPSVRGAERRGAGSALHQTVPPHLLPLPDDDDMGDDADVSRTVPLGSGSTQDWSGSQDYERIGRGYGQSFTSLLHEGPRDDGPRTPVDLSFGLRSGSQSSATRTVLVNPHPADGTVHCASGTRGTRGGGVRSLASDDATAWRRAQTPPRPAAHRISTQRPDWMTLPAQSTGKDDSVGRPAERVACDIDFPSERGGGDGRRVWRDARQEMRRQQEDCITKGVQRLRVGEEVEEPHGADVVGDASSGGDDSRCDVQCEENDDACQPPAGRMGGRAGRGKAATSSARRRSKSSGTPAEGEGDARGEGGRDFWSVDHMVALIRAKRDQDAQLQASGHNYARMRTREWKWNDVRERLLKVGVDRPADKCGKKWDNLMQQFKKVHSLMGASGREDFFRLTSSQRAEKGFNFTMDRAVYEEIKGAREKSHTINPTNVADTGGAAGVQFPSAQSATRESVGDGDVAGDGNDEDESAARGGSQSSGSPALNGKRKNARQQTFEALADCMDKHGALMAATMETSSRRQCEALESASKRQCSIQLRQCEAMEAELQIQKDHSKASNEVSKLMCEALLEIAKAIRER